MVCTDLSFNSDPYDECITGKIDAKNHAISLTHPYSVGFAAAKTDRLISLNDDDACSGFSGTNYDNCEQGYISGWAMPVNSAQQQMAIAANKETLAYKSGFFSGSHNQTLQQSCNGFNHRDGLICANAYKDGYLTIAGNYNQIFYLGFSYGFQAASSKNPSPDRTDDCSFSPVDVKKSAICIKGWNSGFEKEN
jgi:hypothetical protein